MKRCRSFARRRAGHWRSIRPCPKGTADPRRRCGDGLRLARSRAASAHGRQPAGPYRNAVCSCAGLPAADWHVPTEAVHHQTLGLQTIRSTSRLEENEPVCLRARRRDPQTVDELRQILELDKTCSRSRPHFMMGVNLALMDNSTKRRAGRTRRTRIAPWFPPVVGTAQAAMLKRAGEHGPRERAHRAASAHDSDGYGDPIGTGDAFICCAEKSTPRRIGPRRRSNSASLGGLFFLDAPATALQSSPRWPRLAKMMNLRTVN